MTYLKMSNGSSITFINDNEEEFPERPECDFGTEKTIELWADCYA